MKNKGLTLVELIIVVSIIAVLAIITIAYFRGQIFKGNDAKRKSDINRIGIAVEEYEKDHNCYPLTVNCSPGTGLQPYLDRIPCDPTTHASYYYEHEDNACPGWFKFYTNLEDLNDTAVTPGIGPNSAFNYLTTSANISNISGGTEPGNTSQPSAIPGTGFYGCKSGSCILISWDASRPGPECDPNYQNSSCYHQCDMPANECTSWK